MKTNGIVSINFGEIKQPTSKNFELFTKNKILDEFYDTTLNYEEYREHKKKMAYIKYLKESETWNHNPFDFSDIYIK